MFKLIILINISLLPGSSKFIILCPIYPTSSHVYTISVSCLFISSIISKLFVIEGLTTIV